MATPQIAEVASILTKMHEAKPKASLLYARIVLKLIEAKDRTMSVSDLSDVLGRGRDSTSVQQAVEHMVAAGLATRGLEPAGEDGGRKWVVQLLRKAG